MGLTGNRGMNGAMGLVHSNADRWGIALLEDLMMRLVSDSETQQPREYECLEK